MEPEKLEPLNLPMAPEPAPEKKPEFTITTGAGPVPNLPAAGSPTPQPDFFAPETLGPSPIPEGVTGQKKKLKTVFLILASLVLAGGLGAFSYFVIFPLVFPPKVPQTVQKPPVQAQLSAHKSFLTKPPAAEAEIKLSDNSYQTIALALQTESYNQLAEKQFKEVKIFDKNGQVSFAAFLAAVAPATSALGGTDWFENDFTAVFYYDASGVWPLYIAKIKTGVDPEAVKSGLRTLENIIELGNFYLTPPGTFKPFKDGKAGNYPTRYAVGTKAGAAFNYSITGNYLLISTNYNGLKSVLPLLGL